jgi:anti-sigma factor RsiW
LNDRIECEQIGRAGAYHDGELVGAARADFERHLAGCADCAAELARARGLARMLGGMGSPALPAGSLARMHRGIDRLAQAGVVHMAEVMAAVAAAVLIVCMAGLARPAPAQRAVGALPDWEAEVVVQQTVDTPAGGPEELWARWMVQDLSRKGGHE